MTVWNATKITVIAAMMLALVPTAVDAQDLAPVGVWLFPNKRFEVEIAPCGGHLCGKIAWLLSPADAQGDPRTDRENADPALRNRPLLGLTVLRGLRQVDAHDWEDGTIYNADDGASYSATLSIASDGTLHVHAYEFVALLGKTIILTRVS